MENEKQWQQVGNIEEKPTNEQCHHINVEANRFCKECKDAEIPVFVAYYLPQKGYKYKSVFPEEIETNELKSEYGKFKEFLKVCIDFNKEDYLPGITNAHT